VVNHCENDLGSSHAAFLLALMAPALLGSHRIQVQNHTECQKHAKKLSASMAYASLSVAERIQNGLLNVGFQWICEVC